MQFLNYCEKNRILLAMYSPHSTHTLQPLDVALFRFFSQAYSTELFKFMTECQGFSSLSKRDFFRLFWTAWKTSFTAVNILSVFEITGLHSFNPHRVIANFHVTMTKKLLRILRSIRLFMLKIGNGSRNF